MFGFRNEDLVHPDLEAIKRRLDTLMLSIPRPTRTYDATIVDGYGHAVLGDIYHINMFDSKQEIMLKDLQEKINALHQRSSHQYGMIEQVSANTLLEQTSPSHACPLDKLSHTSSEDIAQKLLEAEYTRQFMLSTLKPKTPPNDMLQLCRSIAERRRHTVRSILDEASFLPQLKTWLTMSGSAMCVLQPDLVSEDQTKDLIVDLIMYFNTSGFPTSWYLRDSAQRNLSFDPEDMIKTMSSQLINSFPDVIKPHDFRMPCTGSEWMRFFSTILSAVPKCFMTIKLPQIFNTDDDNWYQWLLNSFKDIITNAGHNGQALKVLILASTTPNPNLFTDEPCRVFHAVVRSTFLPFPRSRIATTNQNMSLIGKLDVANLSGE